MIFFESHAGILQQNDDARIPNQNLTRQLYLDEVLERLEHSALTLETPEQYSTFALTFSTKDGKKEKVNLRVFSQDAEPKTNNPTEPTEKTNAFSQTIEINDDVEMPNLLGRRFHFSIYDLSAHELFQKISAECKAKIVPEHSLAEHRVSLWAKDCSIKSLLDLLAELNE